jgi:hypothetical protein
MCNDSNTSRPDKSYSPFSISLSFRAVGDGGSISKGRISSLKARVRYILWSFYFVTWQWNLSSLLLCSVFLFWLLAGL